MAQDNTGKWANYENGLVLYGPAGLGQNLNTDLQKRLADEVDLLLQALVGDGVGSGAWVVSAGAGLSVNIAGGIGILQGQVLRTTGTSAVGGLPPSTPGLQVYATAASPWDATLKAWPVTFGAKTTALAASEMLLATVETDGSSVILLTDRRRVLTPISDLTMEKVSRARQAASGVL